MTSVSRSNRAAGVRATDLRKGFGERLLWSDITFEVAAGTATAITGPSGAGKSTLLNCIGLLERPDAGTLQIDDEDVTRLSRSAQRRMFRMTVGHLFQNYALVPEWRVRRNLDVAFIGQRVPRAERAALRATALERVGLPGVDRQPTHTLSGGEQQRVALARLLLRAPRVVVADEPTAALDDENVEMTLGVLNDLRDAGSTIIVATHDDRVAAWCDARLELARPKSR